MRTRLRAWILAAGLGCVAAWSAPARAEGIVWTITCLTNDGASTSFFDSAKECNAHRLDLIALCADPKEARTGPRAFTDVCKHPEHGRQCSCDPHTVADASGGARMWALRPGESEWVSLAAFATLLDCEASRASYARSLDAGWKQAGRTGRVTVENFACRPER
jgi:hypothetical protein